MRGWRSEQPYDALPAVFHILQYHIAVTVEGLEPTQFSP